MSERLDNEKTSEVVWGSLSQREQEGCAILGAVENWMSGQKVEFVKAITGFSEAEIEELQRRGILESAPAWKYAQEFIDQNRENSNPIILFEVRSQKNVVRRQDMDLRCRLRTEALYNYIRTQFADEE